MSLDRDFFQGAVAQRRDGALKILRRILRLQCQRQSSLNEHIAAGDEQAFIASKCERFQGELLNDRRPNGGCSFDYLPYLPILPFFEGFSAEDIARLHSHTTPYELPKGALLCDGKHPLTACYIVVHGSVSVYAANGRQERQLAVLGPGRVVGLDSMLDDGSDGTTCAVRSDAVVLELSKKDFDQLFFGNSPISLAFLNAISRNLVQSLSRSNNDLTRIKNQQLIRSQNDGS